MGRGLKMGKIMGKIADFLAGVSIAGLAMAILGCAAPIYEYTSQPVSGKIETPGFSATLTPEKNDSVFFSWLRLDIKNLSDAPLELDWNQTRYLLDGKNRGGFVFEGIDPKSIRKGDIPKEVILPGQLFSKQIIPQAKIALSERRDHQAGKDRPGLYGGILPAGENGVLLTMILKKQLIRKKIAIVIIEEKK